MARAPSRFRQRDVTRLVKGVVAAGLDVMRVEVDIDGRINVFAGRPGHAPTGANALDQWMAAHAGKSLRTVGVLLLIEPLQQLGDPVDLLA